MALTLPLLFLSPYLLTLSFLNKTHNVFYIFFFSGIITGFFALLLGFKGLKTIGKSIFTETQKSASDDSQKEPPL